jgi:hypothetical protein
VPLAFRTSSPYLLIPKITLALSWSVTGRMMDNNHLWGREISAPNIAIFTRNI